MAPQAGWSHAFEALRQPAEFIRPPRPSHPPPAPARGLGPGRAAPLEPAAVNSRPPVLQRAHPIRADLIPAHPPPSAAFGGRFKPPSYGCLSAPVRTSLFDRAKSRKPNPGGLFRAEKNETSSVFRGRAGRGGVWGTVQRGQLQAGQAFPRRRLAGKNTDQNMSFGQSSFWGGGALSRREGSAGGRGSG